MLNEAEESFDRPRRRYRVATVKNLNHAIVRVNTRAKNDNLEA
jgi:hypothetical protein